MAIVFSDNFNAGDQDLEDDYGNGWFDIAPADFNISSNKILTGTSGYAYNTTDVLNDDYKVKFDFDFQGSGSHWIFVAGRMQAGNDDDHYFYYMQEEGSNDWSELYKRVSDVQTKLGSRANHGDVGAGVQKVELQMVGTEIKGIFNDVDQVTVTDSAHSSKGYFGLRMNANDTADNCEVDNFLEAGAILDLTSKMWSVLLVAGIATNLLLKQLKLVVEGAFFPQKVYN